MKAILWTTPVDENPPNQGGVIFAHYATPLVSQGKNVIVTVRKSTSSGSQGSSIDYFKMEARKWTDGSLIYSQDLDWIMPPHGWILACGTAIGPDNQLYGPGAGGTIMARSDADSASATVSRLAFYGISNYNAASSTFNSSVKINTPLVVDSSGNLYFGFLVSGTTPGVSNLKHGLAKIAPDGTGSWLNIADATGLTNEQVATGTTPAISADGNTIYIAANGQSGGDRIVSISTHDSTDSRLIGTLQHAIQLKVPGSSSNDLINTYGTSSPMVAPDGTVFFGCWNTNHYRGFMHHMPADLTAEYLASPFGWDDTPSVVPASAVPSYHGNSSYLILSKYNNYAPYGDGQNKVAIMDPDPNATPQAYTADLAGNGYAFNGMPEVLTVVGPTPNTDIGGVDEWCINTAAVDAANKCVILNSEDGHAYRWDLTTNTLVDNLNLATPTGEAYTSTIIGSEGLCFATNNAILNVMWDNAGVSSLAGATVVGGNNATVQINLSSAATGPGAVLELSSSNSSFTVPASVTVPAGASSVNVTVTTPVTNTSKSTVITAKRYGTAATATVIGSNSKVSSTTLTASTINGFAQPTSATATVKIANLAPTAGRTITLTSDLSGVHISPASQTIASGNDTTTFTVTADGVATNQVGHLTATDDLGGTVTVNFTVAAALFRTLTVSPTAVIGGTDVTATATVNGKCPPGGLSVPITYTAHTSGPSSIVVGNGGLSGSAVTGTGTVHTTSVTSGVTETLSATYGTVTSTAALRIAPTLEISSLGLSTTSVLNTYNVTGTVTLNAGAVGSGETVTLSKNSSLVSIPATVKVNANATTATFTIGTLQVGSPTNVNISATDGGVTKTVTLTINPLYLASFTLNKTVVHSGDTFTGTVTLDNKTGSRTVYCRITTSASEITIPDSGILVIPTNSKTATITMTAGTITSQKRIIIYAKMSGVSRQVPLTISP